MKKLFKLQTIKRKIKFTINNFIENIPQKKKKKQKKHDICTFLSPVYASIFLRYAIFMTVAMNTFTYYIFLVHVVHIYTCTYI